MASSEKLINKTLIYPGRGDLPEYCPGTKATFHFCTRRIDGKVLDDSKVFGKPMELIMGKKFKLEVWEACVTTMKLYEIACFRIDKSLVTNYPLVAKTLRSALGNLKTPSSSPHCCGMMRLQTEGLGFPDLDELLHKPEDLEFIFELMKIEMPGDYSKEPWAMSDAEKLNIIPFYQEQGNNLYQQQQYSEAAAKYAEALGLLEQLSLREKPGDEEWIKLDKRKIPLLLNYAQCKLLLKDFYAVIEHTTTVLQKDPDNVKALYRRAKGHIGAWNPDEAQKDLQRAAQLDPSLSNVVKSDLQHLDELRKQYNRQQHVLLKKMF